MSEWKTVRIGDFLKRVKIPIKLDPTKKYNLVTVRMHHQGVTLREQKLGKMIGSNMHRVSKGQFILSGIDSRNGAFGVIPEELDGAIVTNDFWYFDIDEKTVSRDFFLWLTSTPLFLDACIKSSEGTTNRRRLQPDKFYNFEFVFPEIHHQKALLKKLSGTDLLNRDLSTELDQQLSLLKQLRQSILQEAVEGKLTADWRKKNPVKKGDPEFDAVALLATIKAEKERLIKDGKIRKEKSSAPITEEGKPFELPRGWVWCQPSEIGQFSGGGTPSTHIKEYWGGSIPWITPKDMKADYIHSSELTITEAGVNNSNANILPINTLIFVVRSGILKRTVPIALTKVKGTINQDLKAWSLIAPAMAEFLRINIKGNETRILRDVVKKGMTVESFNFDIFKNYPLPLPSLAEQRAIVTRVNSLMSSLDELENQITERQSQTEVLMQSVLWEAFEGGK